MLVRDEISVLQQSVVEQSEGEAKQEYEHVSQHYNSRIRSCCGTAVSVYLPLGIIGCSDSVLSWGDRDHASQHTAFLQNGDGLGWAG